MGDFKRMKRIGCAALALAALGACGGGGGGPVTVFTYQTLDSNVPGDSELRALGFTRDGDGNIISVDSRSGTLDREEDAINIAGLIVDDDGRTGDTWTDGTTTVAPSSISAFNGVYDFVLPVEVTDASGATTYLIGVASRFEDIPSGNATYSGQSQVSGILGGGGSGASSFDASGNMTLTADFQNSLVDVVMGSLSGSGVPIDTVRLDNLAISNTGGDAAFADSGSSTFSLTNGGSAVSLVGTGASLDAAGSFFGGDDDGPLEAGGTFVIEGDDGVVFGVFIAEDRN